jgi:hypothetical protein
MLTSFTSAAVNFSDPLPGCAALLAQTGPSLSIPWAIVLFGIALGLAITLSPSRRTFEIKRPKDE